MKMITLALLSQQKNSQISFSREIPGDVKNEKQSGV